MGSMCFSEPHETKTEHLRSRNKAIINRRRKSRKYIGEFKRKRRMEENRVFLLDTQNSASQKSQDMREAVKAYQLQEKPDKDSCSY